MDSTIVRAIENQKFDDESNKQTLATKIRALLNTTNPPPSLLTASLAFAIRLDDAELKTVVIEKLSSLNPAAAADARPETAERSSTQKIPEALRSFPELSVVFAAQMLVQLDAKSDTTRHLLQSAKEKAKTIDNRLVQIAVLNECLAIATQAALTQLAASLTTQRDAVIGEQISGVSIGAPGSIDISHAIRTRLLKKSE